MQDTKTFWLDTKALSKPSPKPSRPSVERGQEPWIAAIVQSNTPVKQMLSNGTNASPVTPAKNGMRMLGKDTTEKRSWNLVAKYCSFSFKCCRKDDGTSHLKMCLGLMVSIVHVSGDILATVVETIRRMEGQLIFWRNTYC